MTALRVSLVGLGMAVEPHAESLLELQDRVEVRWAASRSKSRVAAFKSRYPFPVTTNVRLALEDPDVDAVLLLTPPSTHLELGRICLERGKHLLVEKPLELDVERATRLVEAAERARRCLAVVLQHRFRRSSRRAGELIRRGALGRIEAASARVPWWRPQSYYDEPGRGTLARDGGGVLMTQAIHTLDLFRSLVGVKCVTAAQAVTTSMHRMETEDYAAALLVLENGAPGLVTATTAAYPGRPEEIHILGSLGSLSITGDALAFRALNGDTEIDETASETGSGAEPMRFAHDAHRTLICDFLDAIAEGRPPEASGREALASQALIEAILEAAGRTQGAQDKR